MVEKKFSVYLGDNTDSTSAGFDVEGSLMCVLEIKHTPAEDKNVLRNTLERLRKEARSQTFNALQSFGTFIQDFIVAQHVASLAALYVHESTLYAVAHNASIYLNRHGEWFVIAQGNQQSAGEFVKNDLLLLCSETLVNLIDPLTIPTTLLEPKTVTDYITQAIGEQKMVPAASMAITLGSKVQRVPVEVAPVSVEEYLPHVSIPKKNVPIGLMIKKLRIPLFLLIVGLVGWKIVTEVQHTVRNQQESSFTKQISVISPAIAKLQSTLFLDTENAQKATELKTALTKLLSEYPDKKGQLQPLMDEISQMTKTVGDTHISADSLFFDLRLIDKKAQATYLSVSTNRVCMVDSTRGKAYVVAIDSKKQDSYPVPDAKNVRLIGCTNDAVYVFNSNSGIDQISAAGIKNIVPVDKQWGSIQSMQLFNSNIYLLDTIKDEIFKYIPIENGYSDALSYFQTGSSIRLRDARSFVIDFSVYILTSRAISKFTGGVKDIFSLKIPSIIPRLSILYKNTDTEFLYGLSTAESRIVAIDKNGEVTKSIFNPKLKDVKFFGVNKDSKILFLYKNGIYLLDNF